MISCNYAIKLDKTIPVIETVKNGETVQVSTVSAYGADFQNISELMDLIAGKYGNGCGISSGAIPFYERNV